jgi:hypothetical protein
MSCFSQYYLENIPQSQTALKEVKVTAQDPGSRDAKKREKQEDQDTLQALYFPVCPSQS